MKGHSPEVTCATFTDLALATPSPALCDVFLGRSDSLLHTIPTDIAGSHLVELIKKLNVLMNSFNFSTLKSVRSYSELSLPICE